MTETLNVPGFLARAATECGFERERFADARVPRDFTKIVAVTLFGDYRALAVESMLLFRTYRETVLADKYVVLCSHPGVGALFPSADEFWAVSDGLAATELLGGAVGFKNRDRRLPVFDRELLRRFNTVLSDADLLPFYADGLTPKYFERFGAVRRFFPPVPAWRTDLTAALERRGGHRVFVFPSVQGRLWDRGREVVVKFPKDFWIKLVERFLSEKYSPVVYQNQITHDISPAFGERCLYCTERNVTGVLGAMRTTGCVLDLFSGISRLAVVARCPFVAADERQRFVKSKEFEVNDLCLPADFPYRYLFSFPTVIESGNFNEIVDHTAAVVGKFVADTGGYEPPPPTESYEEVPYDVVRHHKARKLGVRFIRVERLEI